MTNSTTPVGYTLTQMAIGLIVGALLVSFVFAPLLKWASNQKEAPAATYQSFSQYVMEHPADSTLVSSLRTAFADGKIRNKESLPIMIYIMDHYGSYRARGIEKPPPLAETKRALEAALAAVGVKSNGAEGEDITL